MTDGPSAAPDTRPRITAIQEVKDAQSDLLVIGVVGAVGAGTSWTARVLKRLLENRGTTAEIVTAREAMEKAADDRWQAAQALKATDPVAAAIQLQSLGDDLRQQHDHAFMASAMIAKAESLLTSEQPPGVIICDSLRHPDEARLLQMVYGYAFWLLGNVCDLETRRARLIKKFAKITKRDPEAAQVKAFIDRDQDDPDRKHGQHVAATFEIADYFVDTSPTLSRPDAPDTELAKWPVTAELGRFLDLIRGDNRITRPTDAEQAMYQAYAARLGSACLSRQVGAALIDRRGQLLATGCNEVPRAGGGLYGQGEGEEEERERGRCHRLNGRCSNTDERNTIIDDVLALLGEENIELPKDPAAREKLRDRLRRSRLGQIVEYSRSVHAEMDALISAARKGVSPVGGKLFVTTFPCHNCARHIVAAGIGEVQFIEPYLKSKALTLHADSITQDIDPSKTMASVARARGVLGPHRVLFRPYVGAAPRLYRRAFVNDGTIKDGKTGDFIPDAAPGLVALKPLESGLRTMQKQIAQKFEAAVAGPRGPTEADTVERSASPGHDEQSDSGWHPPPDDPNAVGKR